MAVYTVVEPSALAKGLARFDLRLHGLPEAVAAGIENTTYFFQAATAAGAVTPFVLTLLENCPYEQGQFTIALTTHLAASGLPVPCPLQDIEGNCRFRLAGRDALIFPRAQGRHVQQATPEACRKIGVFLARSHLAGRQFESRLVNRRGLPWMSNGLQSLSSWLAPVDQSLLTTQVQCYQALQQSAVQPSAVALPTGAIHGDLFRDNALFLGAHLAAVIDYYNACTDWLLLDVAITLNDWCDGEGSGLDSACAEALLQGYSRVRPFTAGERQCWQPILCIAAARFWLSRLLAVYDHNVLGLQVQCKDPDVYRNMLLARLACAPPLPD